MYVLRASHTANHARITHTSRTVPCLCVLVSQIFGVLRVEITDESRMNNAWTAHISFTFTDESLKYSSTLVPSSKYGPVFHEHLTHAWCMNHWRSGSKHTCFANVSRTSTFVPRWTWCVPGSCLIWRWGVSEHVRTWTCVVSNQYWCIITDSRRMSPA